MCALVILGLVRHFCLGAKTKASHSIGYEFHGFLLRTFLASTTIKVALYIVNGLYDYLPFTMSLSLARNLLSANSIVRIFPPNLFIVSIHSSYSSLSKTIPPPACRYDTPSL